MDLGQDYFLRKSLLHRNFLPRKMFLHVSKTFWKISVDFLKYFFSLRSKKFSQFFRKNFPQLSHFQQLSLVFWSVPLSTTSPKILKKWFFLFKEKKQFEGEKHLNFGRIDIATVINFSLLSLKLKRKVISIVESKTVFILSVWR